MRPSELLKLKPQDLSFPPGTNGESDPGLIVIVRNPKTKRIWRRQFVLGHDERIVRWLRWWTKGQRRRQNVLPFSRYVFTKCFQECLRRLGLESCGFTLGSLRAGGATNHFRCHDNLAQLQFHGRWTSTSTLQFYLQEAFGAHVEGKMSPASRRMLETLQCHSSMLNTPPVDSVQSFFSNEAHQFCFRPYMQLQEKCRRLSWPLWKTPPSGTRLRDGEQDQVPEEYQQLWPSCSTHCAASSRLGSQWE